MSEIGSLIERAVHLPTRDRRRLLRALARSLERPRQVARGERRERGTGPYDALLEIAGTVRSDWQNVSTDKYEHLGEIYADDRVDA